MKTKTSILTALVALASGAGAMAQVYSQNTVGYVNVTLKPGFSMIANPLSASTNHLNNILPGMADGSIVYRYKAGTYADPIQYYASVDFTGWFSPDVNEDYTIAPGEGFFVYNAGAGNYAATFVGEVLTGAASNSSVPNGFSIQASKVPQSLPIGGVGQPNTLNFPSSDGDVLYVFDNTTQTYKDTYQYYASVDFTGWFSANVDDPGAAGPSINPGQGFFVLKNGTGPWTRNFSVN